MHGFGGGGLPGLLGETLLRTAVQAGLGRKTQVHAVSDGAAWIADQVSESSSDSTATSASIR